MFCIAAPYRFYVELKILTAVWLHFTFFLIDLPGGGVQHSVCVGARQEAHSSLFELCMQGQPCTRQIRHLKPVQTRRADRSL